MESTYADARLRINTAASGDTTLIAAVAGLSTKVYSLRLSVAGAVIVSIKAGSTVLEVFNFVGAGTMAPLVLRFKPYFQTATNEALVINLSGAVQCNGAIEYTVS